jgi:hypothetical protein
LSLVEGDLMLRRVGGGFLRVPLEIEILHTDMSNIPYCSKSSRRLSAETTDWVRLIRQRAVIAHGTHGLHGRIEDGVAYDGARKRGDGDSQSGSPRSKAEWVTDAGAHWARKEQKTRKSEGGFRLRAVRYGETRMPLGRALRAESFGGEGADSWEL